MNVLRMNERGVREALRHPALTGLPKLARGVFCVVYDKGDTVMKLTADAKQYGFYADFSAPSGEHFPTTVKNHFCVGETNTGLPLYLIESEKLQPINMKSDPAARKLAKRLIKEVNNAWFEKNNSLWRLPIAARQPLLGMAAMQAVKEKAWVPQSLRDALDDVEMFCGNYECGIDFHLKNLMLRGDCLVLNDVVADMETLNREERAMYRA